jgi:hypothetical protein
MSFASAYFQMHDNVRRTSEGHPDQTTNHLYQRFPFEGRLVRDLRDAIASPDTT